MNKLTLTPSHPMTADQLHAFLYRARFICSAARSLDIDLTTFEGKGNEAKIIPEVGVSINCPEGNIATGMAYAQNMQGMRLITVDDDTPYSSVIRLLNHAYADALYDSDQAQVAEALGIKEEDMGQYLMPCAPLLIQVARLMAAAREVAKDLKGALELLQD